MELPARHMELPGEGSQLLEGVHTAHRASSTDLFNEHQRTIVEGRVHCPMDPPWRNVEERSLFAPLSSAHSLVGLPYYIPWIRHILTHDNKVCLFASTR